MIPPNILKLLELFINKSMGTQNSKDEKEKQYSNCVLVRQEEVQALGKYQVFHDTATSKYYLVFESSYSIMNPELAESEIVQLRKLDGIRNACCLLEHSISKSQALCFDNFSISLSFEYYKDGLFAPSATKTLYDEQEIWLIIADLCNYLQELSSFGLSNGDLQPKFILFNQNKVAKVVSPLLYTTYQNAYRLRLANDDYRSTFSPELLHHYQHRNNSPDYDPIRSDIFSLGICLLSYIYSETFESFYNFKDNTINYDKIKSMLSELVKMKYSDELFYFLNSCLKQSFYERATLDVLLKIIASRKQGSRNQYWQ